MRVSMQLQFRVSGLQFQRRDGAEVPVVPGGKLGRKQRQTRNWKPGTGNLKLLHRYSIEILRSSLKSLSILPVPRTTLHSGSSAIETGNPVSSRIRLSRFFNSAPPPVSTMPRSLMSAESSGGVRSNATRIAFNIVATHSASDS